MLDILIKNGNIVDGTGDKAYKAHIGLKGSKIEIIAKDIKEDAKVVIDASGQIVSPGFIDIHGHSDFTLYINNKGESKIRQGITTEVVGNCGFTAAPVTKEHYEDLLSYLANTAILTEEEKKIWRWPSQADFIQDKIASKGLSYNIAPLVGQGTIKVSVMGFKKQEPTTQEMNKMLKLLRNELDRGLFGMSTGLEYEPGIYTSKEELLELCKLVKQNDGIYSTHMRNEGRNVIESILESVEISRKSGVSLEISHLKAQYRPNWGKVKEALKIIDEARYSGIDVGFDVYPYTAFGSGLIDLIPPWAKAKGAIYMTKLLKDEKNRKRVIDDMKKSHDDWENPLMGSSWEDIQIAMLKTHKNKRFEGKNMAEIADNMNMSPYDATIKLLMEEQGSIKSIFFAMCEEDLKTIIKHPIAKFGTDGRAVAPYGKLGSGSVHPRYYGTYPRILGRYVREEQVLNLEEAIKKSTHLPAKKMKFRKRGLLKEGYYADIVIFNKDKITDVGTFDNPHRYPVGIDYVIVNGQLVINKGEHTGKLPGRVLNRKYD